MLASFCKICWASRGLPWGLSPNGGHGSIEENERFNLSSGFLNFGNIFGGGVLEEEGGVIRGLDPPGALNNQRSV